MKSVCVRKYKVQRGSKPAPHLTLLFSFPCWVFPQHSKVKKYCQESEQKYFPFKHPNFYFFFIKICSPCDIAQLLFYCLGERIAAIGCNLVEIGDWLPKKCQLSCHQFETKWAAKTRTLRRYLAQMVLLEAPVQPRGIIPLGGGHLGGTRKGAHRSLAAAANWLLLLTSARQRTSRDKFRGCLLIVCICVHVRALFFPCAHTNKILYLLTRSFILRERRRERIKLAISEWIR